MSTFADTAEQKQALKEALDGLKNTDGPLMIALQKAQDIYGWLPFEVQNSIAVYFGVPLAEVYGIATFYSQFSLKPKGKYKIGVCMGTACYVRGSGEVIEKIKEITKLEPGQTSKDLMFSLDATRCIGCCGLAPVITVNDDVYGKVVADDVEEILKKYE